MQREWKVGELAKFAGLTIRTLRFYDQIDLFSPSGHADVGYRLLQKQTYELENVSRQMHKNEPLTIENFTKIMRSMRMDHKKFFAAWASQSAKATWFPKADEFDFRVGGREYNRGGPPGGLSLL